VSGTYYQSLIIITTFALIKKRQCLLIEDDLDDQEFFLIAMANVDPAMQCTVADNGVEALEKLDEHRLYVPEFIFIDINMPFMNGIECLQKIKQLPHLHESRVYMYSTAEVMNFPASVGLGPNNFIVKRNSLEELTEILRSIVDGEWPMSAVHKKVGEKYSIL